MHRVRLYPTPSQERRLDFMLHTTRNLYNAALQERRDAYKMRGVSVSAKMQYREVTLLRGEIPGLASVYRECEDAVLHRLDLAMAAFFRRMKSGETPGYPRFKAARRWSQLEFPHGDRALKLNASQTTVRVPGVGTIRLRKGREVPSFGRAFVVRKNERWWAVFECERAIAPMPATEKSVGVDRGVRVLAATSDGALIENPRIADRLRGVVEQHAWALEAATERDAHGRCLNRHDRARKNAVLRLARAKEREAGARRDHAHKAALDMVRRYDLIAIEELALRNMTRSARGSIEEPGTNVAAKTGLNRALLDAGFGMLGTLIREKAAWAARRVVSVDPRYSSQTCARCGHVASENRSGERFVCVSCRHEDHADVNAARIILARATAELRPKSELPSANNRLALHDVA